MLRDLGITIEIRDFRKTSEQNIGERWTPISRADREETRQDNDI
jgi:hypothetical protein